MALCHFNPDDANNFKSAAANSADASLAQVYFSRLLHAAFSHDSLCLPWCVCVCVCVCVFVCLCEREGGRERVEHVDFKHKRCCVSLELGLLRCPQLILLYSQSLPHSCLHTHPSKNTHTSLRSHHPPLNVPLFRAAPLSHSAPPSLAIWSSPRVYAILKKTIGCVSTEFTEQDGCRQAPTHWHRPHPAIISKRAFSRSLPWGGW
jgi:hypothetical protein